MTTGENFPRRAPRPQARLAHPWSFAERHRRPARPARMSRSLRNRHGRVGTGGTPNGRWASAEAEDGGKETTPEDASGADAAAVEELSTAAVAVGTATAHGRCWARANMTDDAEGEGALP